MRSINVIALFAASIWAVLLGLSVEAAAELAGCRIPGYPNRTQILVFVGVPIFMLTLTTLSVATANYIDRSAADYASDWSRWVAPIPLICLLCVAAYVILMAL